MVTVGFPNRPITKSQIVMSITRTRGIIEDAVTTLSVSIAELTCVFVGDREMRKVDRIAKQAEREDAELVQISSAFEEDKLKPELAAG